jgi:hypothetical protein
MCVWGTVLSGVVVCGDVGGVLCCQASLHGVGVGQAHQRAVLAASAALFPSGGSQVFWGSGHNVARTATVNGQ